MRGTVEPFSSLELASRRESRMTREDALAVLKHEIRSPLEAIVNALDLLRARGIDAPEHAVIDRQVKHIASLLEDASEGCVDEAGDVVIRKERVDLAGIVGAAVEIAAPALRERRQTLVVDVPAALPLSGDRAKLVEVVVNLLDNAGKYSPFGAVIRLEAGRCAGTVWLAVTDPGLGVEPDMLDEVFEPFVQQPHTLPLARGGVGLGLSIARRIARLHGGDITAESAGVGRGSRFIVELPSDDRGQRGD